MQIEFLFFAGKKLMQVIFKALKFFGIKAYGELSVLWGSKKLSWAKNCCIFLHNLGG